MRTQRVAGGPVIGDTLNVDPGAGRSSTQVGEQGPTALSARQHCALCGASHAHGKFLDVVPGKSSMWACDDCQRMLLLGVDDKGTPGD